MRRLLSALFLLLCAAVCAHPASAAEGAGSLRPYRPVINAYTLGLGTAHICNTYLTPLHYDGWGAALRYERMQAMAFDPQRWVMQLDGTLDFGSTHNPARNANMLNLELRLAWSMMRRHTDVLTPGLSLYWGGYLSAGAGGLLLARNGNNPAQAKADVTIGPAAMAVYGTKLGRLPVTLRYSVRMPLTGAFFSPDYGELYYEIYLGNHSGLVHAAWPGNYFRLDNLLTADLHLGNTCLRVGYACDIFSSKVSHIVANETTHRLVLGITTECISIGRSRGLDADARIISAMY
ncbi:MAG: DUF3316 domain-containing protein [Muribaculaceae bacterium]|nr:DUF3316 domain-containing protein [Muribaculaceae bacterium]